MSSANKKDAEAKCAELIAAMSQGNRFRQDDGKAAAAINAAVKW